MWEFWRSKLAKGSRGSPRSSQMSSSEGGVDIRRLCSGQVNFKDLKLSIEDELSDTEDADLEQRGDGTQDSTNKAEIISRIPMSRKGAEKTKLVIIMVGLPGRGKTFLCNKLKCYLNWLGHQTRHINVGQYRRLQKKEEEVQDASFFDNNNKAGVEARNRALLTALEDVTAYLESDEGQVAIFDATNSTEERRNMLIQQFHGRWQYMFIESICTVPEVLEENYRYKMKYSPDYQGVVVEKVSDALQDFKLRIKNYEEVYEPINNRNLHYIKLIDMVTGRGHMDINRISGYIPGKIVFFLMQVCKAGMAQARKIWLTRHGESEYNIEGKIGGDSHISSRGEEYARQLPDLVIERLPTAIDETPVPVSVWTSTLKRTIETARYLPFPKLRWKALDEIHAGVCDGMTYPQIAQKFPEDFDARKKDKLRYRYPSGESYLDVIQRLEPVIIEMEREKECICVVGHQAILRAIYGYFTATPLKDIPRLEIPLHTLIELQPRPDGTMDVSRFSVDIPGAQVLHADLDSPGGPLQRLMGASPKRSPSQPSLKSELSLKQLFRNRSSSHSLLSGLITAANSATQEGGDVPVMANMPPLPSFSSLGSSPGLIRPLPVHIRNSSTLSDGPATPLTILNNIFGNRSPPMEKPPEGPPLFRGKSEDVSSLLPADEEKAWMRRDTIN